MKSARDIFYSYPKLPVDAPMPMYVPLEEYEALKVKAGNMSQDKERDIIQRDERIFELQTEIEVLKIDIQWLQNQLVIEGHEVDCACVTASSIDCSCGSRDKLLGLLRQWRDKANDGLIDDTFNGVRSPELEQLIADTEAQLGTLGHLD